MRKADYNSFQFAPGDPGSISTVQDLLRYVQELERRIALATTALSQVKLDTQYSAPDKPRDGIVVKADGTSWNPGAGAGVYYYDKASATYKKLG